MGGGGKYPQINRKDLQSWWHNHKKEKEDYKETRTKD